MSAIFLDQKIVHYEVLGRGRPVLLLHGWVGSWRYWIPVMQAVSSGFRAYAIDIWGFGDTAKAREQYHVLTQVKLIEQFIDQMGIGKLAVIGHGLGAILAAHLTKRNPDSVDRLMMVSCPQDISLINSRLWTDSPNELADWLFGRSAFVEPLRSDAPKVDHLAVKVSLEDLREMDLGGIYGFSGKNCLLVHGENDPVIRQPELNQEEIPYVISFEQSGHFPMLDESSKFNRLLVDFLSLKSGESLNQLQVKEEWKRRVR